MKNLRNRVTTTIMLVIFAIAATIRLLTGDLTGLFDTDQLHRYIWPAVLVFLAGYATHALFSFIYRKFDEEEPAESEE